VACHYVAYRAMFKGDLFGLEMVNYEEALNFDVPCALVA